MAFQYSANQFEPAFKPESLRNWEVPKLYTYNEEYPKARRGKTTVVANNKGHLLPGVPRSDQSPWGNFCGTWHMPKNIDRDTADKLNGSFYLRKPTCKEKRERAEREKKLQEEAKAAQEAQKELKGSDDGLKTLEDSSKPKESEEKPEEAADDTALPPEPDFDVREINKENIDDNKFKARPYVPGDLTEEKYKHESYYKLAKNRYNQENVEKHDSSKGYPKYREDFSRKTPTPEKSLTEQVEEFYQKHQEMKECPVHQKSQQKSKDRLLSPLIAAITNFSLAKKLHRENLEHDPLPDTLNDAVYRKLQMQRRQSKDPGLELKNGTFATGVGWKGYPGYGPTRCTKLKVYRPKTCVQDKVIEKDERPASVSSFDKKWRFIRQRKVSPIQLAICWDLSPENREDEPKPPTHIDGSNGSQAPAVFTLVHTPKESSSKDSETEIKCDGIHACGSIFQHGVPKNDEPKNFFFERPKTSVSNNGSSQNNSVNSDNNSVYKIKNKQRAKSAYNINKIIKEENNNNNSNLVGQHNDKTKIFIQSTPNLSSSKCSQCSFSDKSKNQNTTQDNKNRNCIACESNKNNVVEAKSRPKSDYKLAFKAGVPQYKQYVSSKTRYRIKYIKIPKQVDPYCYKKYEINSLAPPFCLQKNRRDYPDHWRLATVYQHSYKPIQARKRPLLQTVFK